MDWDLFHSVICAFRLKYVSTRVRLYNVIDVVTKSRDKVTGATKDSSMFLYLYPAKYWGRIRESGIWF